MTPTERAAWMLSVFLDAARAGRTGPEAFPYLGEVEEVIEALKAPAGSPEGWMLVPIEPTIEMVNDGANVLDNRPRGKFARYFMRDLYSAMLDAAPALLAGDAQAPAILERLRGILMNHEQPHLAVRMSDALKAIDSALAAPTLPAAQEKEA